MNIHTRLSSLRILNGILLVALATVLFLVGVALWIRLSPSLRDPETPQQDPELRTEYRNPFDRATHYVNPFAEYRNPFD